MALTVQGEPQAVSGGLREPLGAFGMDWSSFLTASRARGATFSRTSESRGISVEKRSRFILFALNVETRLLWVSQYSRRARKTVDRSPTEEAIQTLRLACDDSTIEVDMCPKCST